MFPLHPMFLFQSRSFNRGGGYYIYCTLEEICAVIEMIRGEMLPFATTKSHHGHCKQNEKKIKAKCLNSTMEISIYIAIGLKIITVASDF